MSRYMYKFSMSYVANNQTTDIKPECIRSVSIERDYDNLHMPIMIVDFMLDRNLIDTIILNAKSGLFNIFCYKYSLEGDQYTDCIFQGQFNYFLQEDINYNKDIDYTDKDKENNGGKDRKDVYRNIPIGMMLKKNIDNNKHSTNNIVYNTSMINIVTSELGYLGNLVIEPFTYNKTIDQLVIPPTDSVTKLLNMLNKVDGFYDTKFRFFMDFDTSYLLSTSGNGTSMKNEKYNSIIIDVKNITDSNAFEQGMREDSSNNCYIIPISTKDTTYVTNTVTDKDFNKIIAIIDAGKKEADIYNSKISGILGNLKGAAGKIVSAAKNIQSKCANIGNDLTTIKNNIVADVNQAAEFTVSVDGVTAKIDNIFTNPSISVDNKNETLKDVIQITNNIKNISKEIEKLPDNYNSVRDKIFKNVMHATTFDNWVGGVDPMNYVDNLGKLNELYTSVTGDTATRKKEIEELINPGTQAYSNLSKNIEDLIKAIEKLPDSMGGGTSSDGSISEVVDVSEAKLLISDLQGMIDPIKGCGNRLTEANVSLNDYNNICATTATKASEGINIIKSTPNILQEEYNGSSAYMLSTTAISTATSNIVSAAQDASVTIKGFGDLGKVANNALTTLANFKNSILGDIKTGLDGISDLSDLGATGFTVVEVNLDVNSAKDGAEKGKVIRIPNDNTNLLKQMKAELELSGSKLVVNKNDLDCSVLTPNKVYTVKNYDTHSDKNGKFLLSDKKEIYLRQDDSFVLATVLTFRKIPDSDKNA